MIDRAYKNLDVCGTHHFCFLLIISDSIARTVAAMLLILLKLISRKAKNTRGDEKKKKNRTYLPTYFFRAK